MEGHPHGKTEKSRKHLSFTRDHSKEHCEHNKECLPEDDHDFPIVKLRLVACEEEPIHHSEFLQTKLVRFRDLARLLNGLNLVFIPS